MDASEIGLTSVCAFVVAIAIVVWIFYRGSTGRPVFKSFDGPPTEVNIIVTKGCVTPILQFAILVLLVVPMDIPDGWMFAVLGIGGLGITCWSIVITLRGMRAVSIAQANASVQESSESISLDMDALTNGVERNRVEIVDALRLTQVEETRRAWLTILLIVVASPLIFLGGTLLNLNGIITSLILFAVVGAICYYLLILPERQRLAAEAAKPARTIRAGREDLKAVLEKVIGSGQEQIVTLTHLPTGQWIQAVGPGGWLFQLGIGEPGSEAEKRALNWITRWGLHRVFGAKETINATTDEEEPGLVADFVQDALKSVFKIYEGEELDLEIVRSRWRG